MVVTEAIIFQNFERIAHSRISRVALIHRPNAPNLPRKRIGMRFLRITGRILLGLLLLILLFLAVSLSPVDQTPYQQTAYYTQTKQRLAHLPAPPAATAPVRAGWAKVNLTPAYTTPTGGYGVRRGKHWTVINDSVYVRAIVLDNGSNRVAIISLDLLITPPTVTEQLKKRLPEVGLRWENLFIGAIHSHNSLGGWAPGLVGDLIAGSYEARIVTHIIDRILRAIRLAQRQMTPVQIGFADLDASKLVYNRLQEGNPVDGRVRLLKLQKTKGGSALLCTFAGHATLFDAVRGADSLSRDYPGALVDKLTRDTGSFTVFMAGAVGSTGPKAWFRGDDRSTLRHYADTLGTLIEARLPSLTTRPDSALALLTLPLGLRDPSARVSVGWRVRPWLFHAVYGDYPSDLKALRLGPAVLVGTPCDFSGELMAGLLPVADRRGLKLMVTSFNGGYVGYITPDQYYNKDAYETRVMNWFGPGNGTYFSEMMAGLIQKL